MIMTFGRLGSWTGLHDKKLVLSIKQINNIGSHQAQSQQMEEEEYWELFVVVEELNKVHD